MCLLLAAIALFALSAFFYSYQPSGENLAFSLAASYPYRVEALMFVGFGSALMLTASISYSKRSKNFVNNASRRV
jgi:Na+/proline symporter